MRAEWTRAKRLVVKIGSSLLVDRKTGALKAQWLASLCDDIAKLKAQGKQVIVVSSGAIALGRRARRAEFSRPARVEILGPPAVPLQIDGDALRTDFPVVVELARERLSVLAPAAR